MGNSSQPTRAPREEAIEEAYRSLGVVEARSLASVAEHVVREWEKVQRTPHTPTDEEIDAAAQALFYALDNVELRAAARAALVAAQRVGGAT